MCVEPGTIHTFRHDAYAISVDAVGRQNTVTPRCGHPDLISTLYGRLDCFRYACAFKHHPLYVAPTEMAVYGHGHKADVDVVGLAGGYGLIYGRRILEIHFIYHGPYAVYLP
jgi:hypothetical protein